MTKTPMPDAVAVLAHTVAPGICTGFLISWQGV